MIGRKTVLCLLVVAVFLMPISEVKNEVTTLENSEVTNIVSTNALNGGWLEERDGVTILHLNGSYYDMGYQHGYLLTDEIQENMRMMLDFFDDYGFSYDDFVRIWDVMKEYAPEQYVSEMQGMADATGLSLEEIGLFNIWHDVANLIHCCGGIAWGSATVDGELVHLRSGDLTIFLKDPVTGKYLQENQVVIVRDPEYGYASMYPIFAGDVGTYGGINEKGIGVSETTVIVSDTTLRGISYSFRMRMTLEYADSGEEALDIMDSNRTCGWNLFISDGNIPEGYVLEQTANVSYLSTWDNPVEATSPFWMIENVLRRPNCFVVPEMTVFERENYDISGFKSFLRLMTGRDVYFLIWLHYRALSKGFENHWGTLDPSSIVFKGRWVQHSVQILFPFVYL